MENLQASGRRPNNNQAAFVRDSLEGVEALHVIGEIDLANAPEFEAAILGMEKVGGRIVIDLTHCTYLDSSALNTFSRTSNRVSYTVLTAAHSTAQRVLEIANAAKFLSIKCGTERRQ